jgi:hypothetical protein
MKREILSYEGRRVGQNMRNKQIERCANRKKANRKITNRKKAN